MTIKGEKTYNEMKNEWRLCLQRAPNWAAWTF